MEIKLALEKLYSLQKFGIKLGLVNIGGFLEVLGNPQRDFKSFHIAGTNGKGSTASFIASILMEADYKVGLYTSPHFVRFNERIKINNSEIPDEYIARFIDKHYDYIRKNALTFFEATTAMAFKYFADNNIEYGIIETGLGGRLDATNVLLPLASIITSISLEHTEILGSTIGKISEEKAGIIKSNSKIFIGKLPLEAHNVVEEKCKEMNSPFYQIVDYVSEENNNTSFISEELNINNLDEPLKGKYQKYNASLAILAVSKTLGINDKGIITSGLKNVVRNSGLQGRYEIYNEEPKVIFDSAHNIEGVKSFIDSFAEEANKYEKKVLLFGAMKDKAIKEMLQIASPLFDEIHFNQIDMDRCAKIDELQKIAQELKLNTFVQADAESFIRKFIKMDKRNCLVVLGSMYILGTIKEKIESKKKLDIVSY